MRQATIETQAINAALDKVIGNQIWFNSVQLCASFLLIDPDDVDIETDDKSFREYFALSSLLKLIWKVESALLEATVYSPSR